MWLHFLSCVHKKMLKKVFCRMSISYLKCNQGFFFLVKLCVHGHLYLHIFPPWLERLGLCFCPLRSPSAHSAQNTKQPNFPKNRQIIMLNYYPISNYPSLIKPNQANQHVILSIHGQMQYWFRPNWFKFSWRKMEKSLIN